MGTLCKSCENVSDISVDGISLQDIDPANLSAFRTLDPREIGRAMDISGYSRSDLDQVQDIINTDQDNPTDGGDAAVMNLQTDVVLAMQEANLNLPRFTVPENLTSVPPGSFSHLDKFVYIPAEWDQTGGTDEHCGNCWVWADTGALQLDLAYQKNITDRLSVQYFTSSYHNGTGIWACCGGSPVWFADFYNTTKQAIPWNNTNASFVDSRSMCEQGESTAMNAFNIAITPSFPLDQVSTLMISTNARYEERTIANESAINAIKAALRSGKGVLIVYTPDDWSQMMNFWTNQTETDIFTPHPTLNATHNDGGHVMLILGYDDTDSDNRYWTVLNSWGAPKNRPHGLFKLSMGLDYSLQNPDGVNGYEFYVLNVTYPEQVGAHTYTADPSIQSRQ
ncbi:MAG: C1 family peptidase [Methanobacteriota archaeon]